MHALSTGTIPSSAYEYEWVVFTTLGGWDKWRRGVVREGVVDYK
jgi:hypothetical protein